MKYCALTFDDGPDVVMTPLVLEKLEKYGVKATFMQIGSLLGEKLVPVEEKILSLGCEIGNHSWNHEKLGDASSFDIEKSINDASDVIEKYSGKRPCFFRPPYLSFGEKLAKASPLPCICGIVAYDWPDAHTDAKKRAENVLGSIRDGAIILMHDVQPAPHPTPEALDIMIPELLARGYEFVTVSELFRIKHVDPFGRDFMWTFVE